MFTSVSVHLYACQQRGKELLEGQVTQLNEQLVQIQAGFEIASKERDVLLADTVVSVYCPSLHSRQCIDCFRRVNHIINTVLLHGEVRSREVGGFRSNGRGWSRGL